MAETVAMVAIAASAGLSAYSSIRGGYMQERAMKAQAGAMDRQAAITEREAETERQQAEIIERERQIEEGLHEKKTDKILSEYRARMARSGAAMSGSPLEFLGETAGELGYERELMSWQKRREGAIHLDRAKVLMAEAPMYRLQGDIYRTGAKEAVTQGWLGGASSLLKGGLGMSIMSGGMGAKPSGTPGIERPPVG